MSAEPELLTTIEDGVMVVTLNRPDVMNALTAELAEALRDAIREASRDDDVRALVITGAGRGFCSGLDASAFDADGDVLSTSDGRQQDHDPRGNAGAIIEALARSDVPVLAAVNGAAAGAGFGIALSCDMRFVAEGARMGSVFVQRGLGSDFGTSYWLPRLVGYGRAMELLYDGGLIDAARCLKLGIANRVLPAEELMPATLEFARGIAAGAPLAYMSARRLLRRGTEMPFDQFIDLEWTTQRGLMRTEDAAEGFRSFVERREPNYHGR